MSTTITSNNECLNKVKTNNTDNQKNFEALKNELRYDSAEVKMMLQALLSQQTNNVQINDNNKRLHKESNDNNIS